MPEHCPQSGDITYRWHCHVEDSPSSFIGNTVMLLLVSKKCIRSPPTGQVIDLATLQLWYNGSLLALSFLYFPLWTIKRPCWRMQEPHGQLPLLYSYTFAQFSFRCLVAFCPRAPMPALHTNLSIGLKWLLWEGNGREIFASRHAFDCTTIGFSLD